MRCVALGTSPAILLLAVLVGACSGGSGSSGGVVGDGGGETGIGAFPIYGDCSSVAPKSIAGSHTDPAGYTYSWPTGWSGVTSGGLFTVSAPYRYVPTGASAPSDATAYIESMTSTSASESDALTVIAHPYGASGDAVRSFTLGGLPASAFWVRTPPPQPGCEGCPGDPGPDLITIGVAVANGKTVFELTGTARLNAPVEIFCDMQQTEASLALSH
jgi:hypothetical protein